MRIPVNGRNGSCGSASMLVYPFFRILIGAMIYLLPFREEGAVRAGGNVSKVSATLVDRVDVLLGEPLTKKPS
jgi:hypothetical protein